MVSSGTLVVSLAQRPVQQRTVERRPQRRGESSGPAHDPQRRRRRAGDDNRCDIQYDKRCDKRYDKRHDDRPDDRCHAPCNEPCDNQYGRRCDNHHDNRPDDLCNNRCDNHYDDCPNNLCNDRHDSRCAHGCDQRQRQCRQGSHGEGCDADGREGSDRGRCPAAGFRQRGVLAAAGCGRQQVCGRGVRGIDDRRRQDWRQHGERDGRADQCPQRGVAAQSGRHRRGQGDEPLGGGLFWCHAADGPDGRHGGRADRSGLGGVAGLSGGPSSRPLLRCGHPDCYTLESP